MDFKSDQIRFFFYDKPESIFVPRNDEIRRGFLTKNRSLDNKTFEMGVVEYVRSKEIRNFLRVVLKRRKTKR